MSRTFRPPISVFLAHPSAAVREALGDEIAGTGISVIGESGDGRDALARILDQAPDVALLAVGLSELSGAEVAASVRADLPVCRVLMLADDDDADTFDCCLAGALGCFLTGAPQVPLVKAIRGTMRRESLPPPSWATKCLAQFAELASTEADRIVPPPKLTAIESGVLQQLADGATPIAIAEAQNITSHQVRIIAGYAITKLSRALSDEQQMRALR